MNRSEGIHTLAAFAEMLDVIEYVGEYIYGTSYSSQRLDNESKTNSFPASKFSFSTEARDSSKISINSFQCTSSSNNTNILDGSRTLDANEEQLEARSEEQLEARSEEQLEARSEEQLEARSEEQLEARSEEQLEARSEEQLEARSEEQLEARSEEQLEARSEELLAARSEELLAARSEELLAARSEDSSSPHLSTENTTHSLSNTFHIENINNREYRTNGFEKSSNIITLFQHKGADENQYENHGVKKFITSSWNLATIVESLYFLPGPELPEVTPSETKKDVFVLSRGAFCMYPEGHYTMELQHPFLIISQKTDVLMSILLKYADFSTDGNILTLDNKLGRCLYIKCSTREELLEFKQELQKHRSKCYALERIKLVHYPLQCHRNVVIIDLGSCSTRAGILMDQPTLPFIFFPSVCAINKVTGNRVYGKEAMQNDIRQNSNLSFPLRPSVKILQHSIDVDLVEGLFKKIFHDLNVDPTEYTVQVCLPRSLNTNVQNALVKLLLEDFEVKSVSLTHQTLLTLYAHNVSTGIVVDIGDRMDILPVVDGFIVEKGVTRVPHGGQRLIHHMKHALAEKHISLSNDMDSFVVRFISENLGYIPEDYENETKIAPDLVRKSVVLENFRRDDNIIQQAVLDDARFKVPEGLFKPSLWGLDNAGIHQLVQKAIQATGVDVRKKIAENIYVSGGVTTTPGFVERLLKELLILNKPRIVPKVIASKYQYHCSYIGACEFAQMDVFPKVCVNAKEYNKEQISCLKKFVLCF
ncbi:putative actin-9 [Trichonephila clavata]|uniref:Putative actin-9 n=1 Tax=Trichonephila clavata TaxID=2740835 RepID=A0A8X6LK24_TRICU|nr:putative actin-9 [Trichonephila clavata]